MTSYQHSLFLCCKSGDLQQLKNLYEEKNVELNVHDHWDTSPLYYACLCGHYELVEYLLQNGAKCPENTFDGERCIYGALTNEIKNLLKNWKQFNTSGSNNKHYEMLTILLEKGHFSDVTIIVHGKSFNLHRFILAARSPYFSDAFCNKWKGKATIMINNPMVSVNGFSSVVQYIYTGRMSMQSSAVADVQRLARNCQLTLLLHEISRVLGTAKELWNLKPTFRNRVNVLTVESEECRRRLLTDLRLLADHVVPPAVRDWVPDGILPFTRMWRLVDLFPDVSFVVEGYYFLAHRAFFCVASDYFRAILDDHFHENPDPEDPSSIPVYAIKQIGHEAFENIVIYIYTGQFDSNDQSVVLDTLCTSHMLLLNQLTRRCSQVLSRFLDEGNVVDYYTMAKNLDLAKLESNCVQYMAQDLEKMATREDFAALVEADAKAVNDRQAVDSIPLVDDIRHHVTNSVGSISQLDEASDKMAALDVLLSRLGCEC